MTPYAIMIRPGAIQKVAKIVTVTRKHCGGKGFGEHRFNGEFILRSQIDRTFVTHVRLRAKPIPHLVHIDNQLFMRLFADAVNQRAQGLLRYLASPDMLHNLLDGDAALG